MPSILTEKEKSMKRILHLLALSLVGCSPTNNIGLINAQKCNAGIFTNCLNSPSFVQKDDSLLIQSGSKTDFFNSPDDGARASNAPLLLKEVDNASPFTFSAKVMPEFNSTYDAGAIYLFFDNSLWQKFAFELDERGVTRIVTVRTNNTSDDNNHDAIKSKEVFLKISSDGKKVGFFYSVDGQVWQLARLYKNNFPQKIYIALSAQSPTGDGNAVLFKDIQLTKHSITNFRTGI